MATSTIKSSTEWGMAVNSYATIPNNSDLNDYSTPGSFYCPNATTAVTISNSPVTDGGFSLHVESTSGATGQNVVQTAIRNLNNKKEIWCRGYTASNTTWGTWEKIPTRSEMDALISNMGTLKFFRDTANATTFTFTVADASRFRYFLLIGGTSASAPLLYHGFINTDDSVALNKIIDPASRTVSASYNGTTLTITSTATLYGGVRILYLD